MVVDELERLYTKIESSNIFIVLATNAYLESLRDLDREIMTQIQIARQLKKPFFVVIDSRLSMEDISEINEYFSKDNIIKRVIADMTDPISAADKVSLEIKKTMKDMIGSENRSIDILTGD